MKCCIVRDLLPGYIDGLNSEETDAEVRKHLETCAACRTVCQQMSAELPEEPPPKKKDIDFLKKLKEKLRHRYAFGAFLICAAVICVVSYLKAYNLPVPYDSERMSIELFQNTYTPNDYGLMVWSDVRTLDEETAEAAARGEYETVDELRFVLQENVRSDGVTSRGRTIRRDDKTVRVVYYCYTRSLWNNLFRPGKNGFMDSSVYRGAIYEKNFFRESLEKYEPLMREIYYLPMGNMNRLNRLSDEEFDAQREDAVLVWSGVI